MGWLAKGTSGFGVVRVRGRRRVPKPPTRMIAFIVYFLEISRDENFLSKSLWYKLKSSVSKRLE